MRPASSLLLALAFSAVPFVCADAQSARPVSAAAAPLDYEFFKVRVQPIFLAKRPGHARCISCHTMRMTEKLSHGTPAFFVEKDKGVFAMFADNHHEDGHLAVWLPVPEDLQSALIEEEPATYFKPPYVGSSGWIGIELARIRDDALEGHLREAWQLVARKVKSRTAGSARRPRSRL